MHFCHSESSTCPWLILRPLFAACIFVIQNPQFAPDFASNFDVPCVIRIFVSATCSHNGTTHNHPGMLHRLFIDQKFAA
jgi:hypothetical protein